MVQPAQAEGLLQALLRYPRTGVRRFVELPKFSEYAIVSFSCGGSVPSSLAVFVWPGSSSSSATTLLSVLAFAVYRSE